MASHELFSPEKHGFHFPNHFETHLIDIGSLNWTTHGICGGMAFSAMDYYLAGMAVPSHVENQINPNPQSPIVININDVKSQSRLIQYLFGRLIDSLVANWETYVSWTEKNDSEVSLLTKGEEFKKLEAKIQQFGAWPIGLVRVDSIGDIGKDHQVVAYQCWTGSNGDKGVRLYDNNFPNEVTTLTSKMGELAFTSDRYNDWRTHIRGFFVEDYVPQTPTYVDLVFTQGLDVPRKKPLIGDPVEASYTLRNDGQSPTTLTPCIAVYGQGVLDLSALILDEVTLNPGEEHVCSIMNSTFGSREGSYTLTAGYLRNTGSVFISALPGPGPRTATLEIYYPNEPPYVKEVMALKAPPGQTPIGFGGFNISNLTECQKAKLIYSASWGKRAPDGTRTLNTTTNETTTPTKALYIFLRFGWDSSGFLEAPMKAGTVKLTLKRLDANNQVINAIALDPLPGLTPSGLEFHYWACMSWASFTGAPWRASDRLYLEIEGTDVLDHYPGRTPIGNVIDSKPETVAVPDPDNLLTQYIKYEPGTDQKHSISVILKSPFKTTDTLELNDSFATASQLKLGMPGPTGSVLELKDLSIGTSNDVDYYKVQYQSPDTDDNWTGPAEPKTTESAHGQLGLRTTLYPPSLQIDVYPKDDCCVSLELYRSNPPPLLDSNHPSSNSVVVYAPTRVFKDHSLYVVVKNADYATQGGFAYDLKLTYRSPYATSVITRVPLGYDYHIFIRRYCDAMAIPVPSLEAIREAIAAGKQYVMNSTASIDATTQVKRYAAFLNDSATQKIIQEMEGENAGKTIAGMLYDAAKLAETLALSDDAENLYKSSAVAAGKDTDTKSLVLRDLASLYERTGRNSKAKELLIQIRGRGGQRF